MLRLYKPIKHDIFKLHSLIENLICNVWCEACDDICDDKLQVDFKAIYHYAYKSTKKNPKTLKDEVERVYELFKGLTSDEKNLVKQAFATNNDIEGLCNGNQPVYLSDLPDIVTNDIKPLFKWCYETLLDQGKVAGDKMDYYKELIKSNEYNTCPCCGLILIESPDSICREDFDHYLPKSKYPFASVNFLNLVPLCNKCNRDRKKAKDPIENDRVVFYPFSQEEHNILINYSYSIDFEIVDGKILAKLKNLAIRYTGEKDKIATWDWLFDISIRYNDILNTKAQGWLRELMNRHYRNKRRNQGLSLSEIIQDHLDDYEENKFSELKFLKIAFLQALIQEQSFINAVA